MIRVGLCGFTIAMREYVETFRVVEIQHTFYDPPAPKTLVRWREQCGPRFEFTIKAWQLVTHEASSKTYRRLRRPLTDAQRKGAGAFKPSDAVRFGWETTLAAAHLLRATAILFQCPASFRATEENADNMRRFFRSIERPEGTRLLWEPRGPWPDDLVLSLCSELDLVHAVDPFLRPTLTPQLAYYRVHGLGDHYRSYTDDELRELHARAAASPIAYVMFNEVPRYEDARRFVRLTSLRSPSERRSAHSSDRRR